MMRRPDLFIVGAPKCGTTALNEYLRAHPDIYIPPVKELHFFGQDLTFRFTPRITEREYLQLFVPGNGASRLGEASVRYLQSRTAAGEMHSFSPSAQIIAMLRNPVDMMYAMHSELCFSGMEDISSFEAALDAEQARMHGRLLPAGTNVPEMLYYRTSARFAGQLERYFEVFGRERVRVILLDDMRADAPAVYRETLEFLGVDSSFAPQFRVVNPAKTPRSKVLRSLVATPPGPIRAAARRILSRGARKRAYQWLLRLNAKTAIRRPMDRGLRTALVAEFLPEVERLEQLLDRDLSTWKQP